MHGETVKFTKEKYWFEYLYTMNYQNIYTNSWMKMNNIQLMKHQSRFNFFVHIWPDYGAVSITNFLFPKRDAI